MAQAAAMHFRTRLADYLRAVLLEANEASNRRDDMVFCDHIPELWDKPPCEDITPRTLFGPARPDGSPRQTCVQDPYGHRPNGPNLLNGR